MPRCEIQKKKSLKERDTHLICQLRASHSRLDAWVWVRLLSWLQLPVNAPRGRQQKMAHTLGSLWPTGETTVELLPPRFGAPVFVGIWSFLSFCLSATHPKLKGCSRSTGVQAAKLHILPKVICVFHVIPFKALAILLCWTHNWFWNWYGNKRDQRK